MSIENNAFDATLVRERDRQRKIETKCMDCEHPGGVPGTVCDSCGRGIVGRGAVPTTMWIISTESRSYDWFVMAHSEAECRKEFKRMWLAWCKASDADKQYWATSDGDQFGDVSCYEVEIGAGYMDREKFR